MFVTRFVDCMLSYLVRVQQLRRSDLLELDVVRVEGLVRGKGRARRRLSIEWLV